MIYCFPVLCPPSFIVTPDSMELVEGKHAKFSCKAHGKPVPEITWYREDELITGNGIMKIQSKANTKKLEMESSLQTSRVTLGDESPRYVIKAENQAGNVFHEFNLTGIKVNVLV